MWLSCRYVASISFLSECAEASWMYHTTELQTFSRHGFSPATLFFFDENLFYKNVESEIDPDFKNLRKLKLRDKAVLCSSTAVFASI